jgi:hypothetical protein
MERTAGFTSDVADTFLMEAPSELTAGRLRRLGEGIGKVVYASDHWVVKRDRSISEVIGLILVWKSIRKAERFLPKRLCERLLSRPSRQIRFLRVLAQASMAIIPKTIWYSTHIREMWKSYYTQSKRGERLAEQILSGTLLVPGKIEFPPTRVRIGGWPGWLTVSEADERVDMTLPEKLEMLAREDRFDEIERWLNKLLDLRQSGWRHGLFSADAHLKNFGVIGDRVVLLDTGGLTNRWTDIEPKLRAAEKTEAPHVQLGLGPMLEGHPEIAERLDARWRATVNRRTVRELWRQSMGEEAG